MRHERSALTLVEVLVVVGIVAILAVIGTVWIVSWQKRAKVARTRNDMRRLAVAIESYFVWVSTYPVWGMGYPGPGALRTFNYDVAQKTGNRTGIRDLPCFLLNDFSIPDGRFMTLTTPVNYLAEARAFVSPKSSPAPGSNEYPVDHFSHDPGATFLYWNVWPGDPGPSGKVLRGLGWIVVSAGPDGDYDLAGAYDAYTPSFLQPSGRLWGGTNKTGSALTYDPTNGLISDGDIWRCKQ